MSKGFSAVYVLVGILVLVGIAGGTYFLGRQTLSLRGSAAILPASSPTPSVNESTSSADMADPDLIGADWKTYTNTKYGFSIQYLDEWKYLETPTDVYKTNNPQVWFGSGFPMPNTDSRAEVTIIISKEDPSSKWNPEYFENYKSEPVKLGNVTGTYITGNNKITLERKEIAIIIRSKDYYFEILPANFDEESLKRR